MLLGELLKPEHRGRALGTVHSAAALGSGIAALLAGPVAAWISPEYGWRVVFWMGALPAVLVLFIRRGDDDSEIYKESRRTVTKAPGVTAIFARSRLPVTAAAALLAVGAQGAGFAVSNYLTTFLVQSGTIPLESRRVCAAQQPRRIHWLPGQWLDRGPTGAARHLSNFRLGGSSLR